VTSPDEPDGASTTIPVKSLEIDLVRHLPVGSAMAWIGSRNAKRLCVILILFAAGWYARQRITQMDAVWFQPSFSGNVALVRYLAADYSGAARSYRAHFARVIRAAEDTGDGGLALLGGDHQRAATLAQARLAGDPDDAGSLLTLGEIALEEGKPGQALAASARILRGDPEHFDAQLLAVLAHTHASRYAQAIEEWNRALRTGKIGARMTLFLSALDATGALASRSGRERPACLLAHYHRYFRIFDEANAGPALRYARHAIDAGDRADDAYLTQSVIYWKQGKREQALRAALMAIEINPKNSEALRWAGQRYLQRGDLVNGYYLVTAAFDASPTDLFYARDLYDIAMDRLGDYPAALRVAQTMQVTAPHDPRALPRVARALQALGDYSASEAAYREATQRFPNDPTLWEGLGESLRSQERADQAEAAYRRAAAVAPGRPWPRYYLGLLYLWSNRPQQAVVELEDAMKYGVDAFRVDYRYRADVWATLCHAYQAALDFGSGIRCFRAIGADNPNQLLPLPTLPEALNNMYVAAPR
jgi:tetratricopeptide (TPR) repeat protein